MKKTKHIPIVAFFTLVYMAICPELAAQKPLTPEQKTWTPAPAVITRFWQKNMVENGEPLVGIELQVTPSTGDPFTVQINHLYSVMDAGHYSPGNAVQVRYDPKALPINPNKKTTKVVVESFVISAMDTISPAQVALYTAEIQKNDSLHRKILSYGDSAEAVVVEYKSYRNLNLMISGNNPVVTLELEVMPKGKTPFRATVVAVLIKASSVPKFQPGKMIYVKYDPNDLTKVSPYHSE